MAYLGKTPSQAVRSRFYFTASGGETSLAPAQVTGLSFTDANYVDVSLNGVALVSGTDYTATPSTNTISSLAALTASDVVEIVVYDVFSVFGGNVNGDFTISNGTLAAEAVTVTGLTTTGNINFGDNDKAVFGAGSDLQIYHDGSNSYITEGGDQTGDLFVRASNLKLTNASGDFFLWGRNADSVRLYHNNAQKLETTSTGIDVTGTVTADGLTVDTTTLVVDSTNNRVGVGTSSPSTLLHLDASADGRVARFGSGTSDTGGMYVTHNSGSTRSFEVSADNILILDADRSNGRGSSRLQFNVDGSERLRIDSSGNVGIGTSSLSHKLHVYKSSVTQARISTSTNGHFFECQSDNNTDGFEIYQQHGSNTTRNSFIVNDNRTGSKSAAFLVRGDGNVGIGTSSPSEQLNLVGSGGASKIRFDGNSSNLQNNFIGITGYDDLIIASDEANTGTASTIQFRVDGSEAMRIDDDGRMLVGDTTNVGSADHKVSIQKGSGGRCLGLGTTLTSASIKVSFVNGNGTVGTIQTNGTATSYNTSSDHRLKENAVDMTGAITRVKQLAPKRFNFIADADTTVDGFLAHEAQTVVPEAVTGTHNEVDADGNAVMQGIDQSKLVPLLTAALKESIAKIETLEMQRVDLEARLTALENAE